MQYYVSWFSLTYKTIMKMPVELFCYEIEGRLCRPPSKELLHYSSLVVHHTDTMSLNMQPLKDAVPELNPEKPALNICDTNQHAWLSITLSVKLVHQCQNILVWKVSTVNYIWKPVGLRCRDTQCARVSTTVNRVTKHAALHDHFYNKTSLSAQDLINCDHNYKIMEDIKSYHNAFC